MASDNPDPSTLGSWEDAFQYPIPVVRKLENQLRSHANENREKLRSLVGASYRDLLDTAETIIDMELRMQRVENDLAQVGQKCNSRGIERIWSNTSSLLANLKDRDSERYTFAAHSAVLQSCPNVMTRLMKESGSHLLAAKVLVISRLLYKALSQSPSVPPFLDQIRRRIGSLRGTLLSKVDNKLSSPSSDLTTIIECMCAYSLATSSTPTDILRHFHKVRLEKIVGLLRKAESISTHSVAALKLYLKTCQDTQAIFPRRLAESLAKLKAQPLLQDPEVQSLHQLKLDIHARWIQDEARNYTPWPRHDELKRSEAERLLTLWSKDAISAFIRGLKHELSKVRDLGEVAPLRRQLIETMNHSGIPIPGLKPSGVLNDLRGTINDRLQELARSRADISSVLSELHWTLSTLSPYDDKAGRSLWAIRATSDELDDGCRVFKSSLTDTYRGRNESLNHVVERFDTWAKSVLEVKSIVKAMREARWDDSYESDSSDSDDEFSPDSRHVLLTKDDPLLLENTMQIALATALETLQAGVAKIVDQLTARGESFPITQAMFLLRFIREIADRIPQVASHTQGPAYGPTSFTSSLLDPLHSALATSTSKPALECYRAAFARFLNRSASHGVILWEGHPPLPVQPSPGTFKLLRDLSERMGSYGGDLWSPKASAALKDACIEELSGVWRLNIGSLRRKESGEAIAAPEPGPHNDATKDSARDKGSTDLDEKVKQMVFDLCFLSRFLNTSPITAGPEELGGELLVDLRRELDLTDDILARLRKNAWDYSKKTYLLFALLS